MEGMEPEGGGQAEADGIGDGRLFEGLESSMGRSVNCDVFPLDGRLSHFRHLRGRFRGCVGTVVGCKVHIVVSRHTAWLGGVPRERSEAMVEVLQNGDPESPSASVSLQTDRWCSGFVSQWKRRLLGHPRFSLLLLGVGCQAATLWITLPLWTIRADPPNLQTFSVPEVDFVWPLFLSLALTVVMPRPGLMLHWGLLVMAAVFDQYRLQPQFFAIAVLMSGCVWSSWHQFTRWFLVSTWLWAGLHKLVSADWFGHASYWVVQRADFPEPERFYLPVAISVAVVETAVGLAACFRPRWAAFGCVPMHLGIVITLSPMMLDWNASVIPWNVAMAAIGSWIMWTTVKATPQGRWQWVTALAWTFAPLGFFVGWLDHGFSGVLYSDSLPRGQVTTVEGPRRISGWGDLHVPFPNERRTLRMYFEQAADPGDFLHISDPRVLLDDQYFVLSDTGKAVQIDAEQFYQGSVATASGPQYGMGLDELRAIFALRLAGVRMLKEAPELPIYAVAFTPENFDSDLLRRLQGLPNLRQVQLSGTSVSDEDMRHLAALRMLTGLGLEQTAITDVGLASLRTLPYLTHIECGGTQITQRGLQSVLKVGP